MLVDDVKAAIHRRLSGKYAKEQGAIAETLLADADVLAEDALRELTAASPTAAAIAMKTALESGKVEPHPFFEWAESQQPGIFALVHLGSDLKRMLDGDAWRHMRVFGYELPGRQRHGVAYTILDLDVRGAEALAFVDGFLDYLGPAHLTVGERSVVEHLAEAAGVGQAGQIRLGADTFSSMLEWCGRKDVEKHRADATRMARKLHLFAASAQPEGGGFGYAAGLTKGALEYDRICPLWQQGFRAVLYNPTDPMPTSSKWLLFPNADECLNGSFSADRPQKLDLSVGDAPMQRLLISWAWRGGLPATAVRVAPKHAADFAGFLVAKALRVIGAEGEAFVVTATLLASYLPGALRPWGPTAKRHIKGWLRSFLEYGEAIGALQVEGACYLHLATNASERGDADGDVDAISLDDLRSLSSELESRSPQTHIDELVYAAFCVQALTPLRISEILTLRTCWIDEEPRPGIRAVMATSTSSGRALRRVQVPESAYRMLDAVRRSTADLRRMADPETADYLFICAGPMGRVKTLDKRLYRSKLSAAAGVVGVTAAAPSNLRKRYMTEVVERGVARNLSRLALRPLTGHVADAVTNRYYLREDIRSYLEAVHGIEIGSPRIVGEVAPSIDGSCVPAALVESGAGVCRNEQCDVKGTVTCLMCSGFLTAPQFIPEMKEAVATLDAQMASAGQHDREHLMSVKRLHLAYLGKMMEMKGATHG